MPVRAFLFLLLGVVFAAGQGTDAAQRLNPESRRLLENLKPATATPRPVAKPTAKSSPAPAAGDEPLPPPRASTPFPIAYTPAARPDHRHVVALDIGHTVQQHGSTSARGEGEFYFNQRIVRQLATRLSRSTTIFPYVINPDGAKIGLVDRAREAAGQGAELFLSIHHDAAVDKYLETWDPASNGHPQKFSDRFHGYGAFMSMKNRQPEASLLFARLLGTAMQAQGFDFSPHHSEPVRGENRPIIDPKHGVYQYDDLIVLKNAPMPAALLECGVIINRTEELQLKQPEVQTRIVEAAATAIESFFAPR